MNYESCDWSPSEMVRFVQNHTSTIGTRIMVPESFQFRRPISDAILNDAEAAANLDIIAGHIYGGGLEFYPLAEDKGKEVWMTEHYTTSDQSANLWPAALEVGNEIHQVRNANMNAYIWWYLVRYYGPIGEGEEDTSKGEITKRGYVMSQFSRFIRPGFHRKEATSNPQSDIFVSAYQGDDKTVIVAINMGNVPKEQQFVFENSEETIGDVVPYLTSSSSNVEQQQAIKVSEEYSSFTFDLPSQSIVTFVTE